MNLKRAVGMGVLVYVISFIIGTVTATLMGVDLTTASELPNSVWLVNIAIVVPILAVFSIWYFRGENVEADFREGLLLGLSFVVIGFILDAALVIPYIYLSDSPSDIAAYYTNPLFWVTIVAIILVASLIGLLKEKKVFK